MQELQIKEERKREKIEELKRKALEQERIEKLRREEERAR
jgi:hypothetical protein